MVGSKTNNVCGMSLTIFCFHLLSYYPFPRLSTQKGEDMKYDNKHYYQAPRLFWPVNYEKTHNFKTHENEYKTSEYDRYKKYHELSVYAKWIYQTLREFEHRYTGKENKAETVVFEGVENDKNWFYLGNDKLSYMSGISRSQVARAKKELINVGLLKTCKVHFIKDGKRTKTTVSGYRVMGETELFMESLRH